MKKVIILVVVLVIVLAALYVLYETRPVTEPEEEAKQEEQLLTDDTTRLLKDLKDETNISFSDWQDVQFEWQTKKDSITLDGQGFEVERISDIQFRSVDTFFKQNGFEVDLYNVTAATMSGAAGYQKDDMLCQVVGGATGYKQATGQWIPPEPDKKDIEIRCAQAQLPDDETADWLIYQNEKYGYSLKYPSPCLLGPLPGYCKQKPPEERAQECRCYFNAENPDEVSLGTFTGSKDNLTGAAISISHYSTDSYNPPEDTDLVEWIKEKFSYLEDIPDAVNLQLDSLDAVRVYTSQSPQAYSQENIYFIKDNQLFNIYMNDVDNQDNRQLYDNIIESFKIQTTEIIDTEVEEYFSIELEANATTGYQWQVDFDKDFVELTDQDYQVDSELIGAGGTEAFEFQALQTGETEITFVYSRPWESVQPLDTRVYQVTIE